MKKKPTRDRDPGGKRDDVPESARLLRELYERGMAEVEARRKIDPTYR
jgi:hypothetical protein